MFSAKSLKHIEDKEDAIRPLGKRVKECERFLMDEEGTHPIVLASVRKILKQNKLEENWASRFVQSVRNVLKTKGKYDGWSTEVSTSKVEGI